MLTWPWTAEWTPSGSPSVTGLGCRQTWSGIPGAQPTGCMEWNKLPQLTAVRDRTPTSQRDGISDINPFTADPFSWQCRYWSASRAWAPLRCVGLCTYKVPSRATYCNLKKQKTLQKKKKHFLMRFFVCTFYMKSLLFLTAHVYMVHTWTPYSNLTFLHGPT